MRVALMRLRAQPTPPPSAVPDGPDSGGGLWWHGKRYGVEDWPPAVVNLLVAVWGRDEIAMPDVVAALRKPKRTKYASLKPTVTRLNHAMEKNGLPFSWGKKRGENALFYKGPALAVGFRTVSK